MRAAQMFAEGARPARVARRLRVTERSAGRWRQCWERAGTDGLVSAGPARRPRLDPGQIAQLTAWIEAGPAAWGWRDQRWTLAWICRVVAERFGVGYSVSGMSRLLRGAGLSWQVPAVRGRRRNEAAVTAFRQEVWPAIKERRP